MNPLPLILFFVAIIAGILGFLIAKLRPQKPEELEVVQETKVHLENVETELQQNRTILQQTRTREEELLHSQSKLQQQVHVVQTQLSQSHEQIQKSQENMQKTLEQTQQLTQALQQSEDSQKRLTQRLREYEEEYLRQQPRTGVTPLATTSTTALTTSTTALTAAAPITDVTPTSASASQTEKTTAKPAPAKSATATPRTTRSPLGRIASETATGTIYLITDQPDIQTKIKDYFQESGYTLKTAPFTHLLSTIPHLATEKPGVRALVLDVYKGNDDQWDMLINVSQQAEVKGIPLLALVVESEKEKAMERGATQSIPWPTDRAMVLSIISSSQIARNLRNDLATRAARLTQSYQNK
jgi:hypothetical protein